METGRHTMGVETTKVQSLSSSLSSSDQTAAISRAHCASTKCHSSYENDEVSLKNGSTSSGKNTNRNNDNKKKSIHTSSSSNEAVVAAISSLAPLPAAAAAAPPPPPPPPHTNSTTIKRKRKMISPFRIKTGCLVACRINHHLFSPHVSINIQATTLNDIVPTTKLDPPVESEQPPLATSNTTNSDHVVSTTTIGSNCHESDKITSASTPTDTSASNTTTTATHIIQYREDSYHLVWTDPVPHRDLHWSLIGKRIRCCYIPDATTTTTPASSPNVASVPAKTKTFDGEVIRLFHNHHDNHNDAKTLPRQQDVELLIDAAILPKLPFLQPIDKNSTKNTEPLSKKERRTFELEQHVARGICDGSHNHTNHQHHQSLVSVRIRLQYPQIDDDTTPTIRTCNHSKKDDNGTSPPPPPCVVIQKWVVQKCVPIRFGKKPSHKNNAKKLETLSNSDECNDNNHITTSASGHGIPPKSTDVSNKTINTAKNSNKSIVITKNMLNGNGTSVDDNKANGNTGSQNGLGDSMKRRKKNDAASSKNNSNNSIEVNSTSANRNISNNHQNYKISGQQLYIGDGNDTPEQQAYNWRFIVSRYHDLLYQSIEPLPFQAVQSLKLSTPTITTPHFEADMFSCGFIGEVLKVDPNAAPSISLAMVTIRRMILPEHTFSGRRIGVHDWNDVYADYDDTRNQKISNATITIPIEQLIVLSRNVNRPTNGEDALVDDDDAVLRCSYSRAYNVYIPPTFDVSASSDNGVSNHNNRVDLIYCHRCRRSSSDPTTMSMTICKSIDCHLSPKLHANDDATTSSNGFVAWCKGCLNRLRTDSIGSAGFLPCCEERCNCISCLANHDMDSQHRLFTQILKRTKKVCIRTRSDDEKIANDDSLSFSASMLESMGKNSSYLEQNITYFTLPIPQTRPKTRIIQRTIRITKPSTVKSSKGTTKASNKADKAKSKKRTAIRDGEFTSVNVVLPATTSKKRPLFLKKNHCAREIVYNASKKYSFKSLTVEERKTSRMMLEMPRSLRTLQESNTRLVTEQKDEVAKTSNGNRAARASQRRLLKDVASLGIAAPSYLGLVDTLANREPQLRFDRSSIHAWGVFADTAISAGEMIVEYRGELIGNAVAELREKEYEAAKIGSDYMFRIDALNVCDATKQGNVARFINASCDPNCYTKIITFDGLKRIVIYAKKDIQAGDELCYDYKFPIEYDETKRIRCRCGARECRGYMNWDKKYVATRLDHTTQSLSTISEHKPIKCASEAE